MWKKHLLFPDVPLFRVILEGLNVDESRLYSCDPYFMLLRLCGPVSTVHGS